LPRDDRFACTTFLERAVSWYADHEIHVEPVRTDNAKSYHSGISRLDRASNQSATSETNVVDGWEGIGV
jgi:hypothetical protein